MATPNSIPNATDAVENPITTRYRVMVLSLLLCVVSLGLWGVISFLPESVNSTDWILGENGNQLFRADQLAAGKSLYGDVDCQYGPLPIWLWYGFTLMAGNTIGANVLFQNLLTLMLVAGLFCWLSQHAKSKRHLFVLALALGLLTFARTPYLYLLASPSANFEYLTFERLCLLGLMLLWRPPTQRSNKLGVGLVLLFLVWQCVKVGGAFMGLGAYAAMDAIWLLTRQRRDLFQTWLGWWLKVSIGILIMEALRCASFVICFESDQGWRSAWPLYVAGEYQRTWLTLWANPRHFITVVLPILALLLPLPWLIHRTLKERTQPERPLKENTILYQAAVGTLFYLIGAVPIVGYFGHEWHFFQYQWVLLPLALVCLRYRLCLGLVLLLLVHLGPLNRTLSELRRATPPDQLERLDTQIGPIIAPKDDARLAVIKTALAATRADAGYRSLIVGTWGGGGWYVAAQELHRPQNIFFSNAIIRRPADNAEFNSLLAAADFILLGLKSEASDPFPGLGWFAKTAGQENSQILEEQFEPLQDKKVPNNSGWVILKRKPQDE